jgi:hypothetical protein
MIDGNVSFLVSWGGGKGSLSGIGLSGAGQGPFAGLARNHRIMAGYLRT